MKKNKKKDLIGFDSNPTVFKKFDVPIPGEEKEKKKKTEWDELDIKGPCKDPNILKADYENFKGYLDIIENYSILMDVPPDVYDKAVKTIKEMLKNLKNGRGDKVYNKERFQEYYSSEDNDDYY